MGTDFTDMPLKKNLTPAQMISNEISSGYASFAPLIGFLDLQRLNRCHCVWVEAFWANMVFSLSEWITKLDNAEAKCMVNISIAQDYHRNRTRQNITGGVVIQHSCCMITSDEAFTMKWIVSSRSINTFNGAPCIIKKKRLFYKLLRKDWILEWMF